MCVNHSELIIRSNLSIWSFGKNSIVWQNWNRKNNAEQQWEKTEKKNHEYVSLVARRRHRYLQRYMYTNVLCTRESYDDSNMSYAFGIKWFHSFACISTHLLTYNAVLYDMDASACAMIWCCESEMYNAVMCHVTLCGCGWTNKQKRFQDELVISTLSVHLLLIDSSWIR